MKKAIVALFLAAAVLVTGCQGKAEEPAQSKTEKVDQASNELKEKLGDGYITPSESVKKVMAKKWNVIGTDSVYDLKEDGTGTLDGKSLTFQCGFDEENNITLGIQMDGEKQEQVYAITTDETGYGVNLESLDGGEDLQLFQADIELLDRSDPEVAALVGTWRDDNENEYVLKEDGAAVIKGSSGESQGTYSVVKNAQGVRIFNLVMPGGSLEYEYTLSEENTVVELCSPGTDTVHRWTKE